MYHSLLTGLIVMLCVDVFIMCYLYKNNYGRSIMHEFNENADDNFIYDYKTHTYHKKPQYTDKHVKTVIKIQQW